MNKKDVIEIIHKKMLIKSIKSVLKYNLGMPQTTMEYYKTIKNLGKGSFGKVNLAKNIFTGHKVAIKSIDKIYMKNDYSRMKIL